MARVYPPGVTPRPRAVAAWGGGAAGESLVCVGCQSVATLDGVEAVPADDWCPLPADCALLCSCECHATDTPCGAP